MDHWTVEIDRDDIRRAALVHNPMCAARPGEIAFEIDLVALTANNITYAALGSPNGFLGEDAGYWDFFSTRGEPGRVPVWGFATVTRSRVAGVAAGERFYGYWPLASRVVIASDRTGATGFVATEARRQRLPALYNHYQRVAMLPDHRAADHELWPVWRPLQITGWLVADQLADETDHGAAQVLATAASSKTALAFAHAFRQRVNRPRLIGLTSPRSEAFVHGTGLYDEVVTYERTGELAPVPTVLVDFANAAPINAALRKRLGHQLRFDLVVGYTHWNAPAGERPAGVRRTGFFAPDRLTKRGRDWGDALRTRMADAWRAFMTIAPILTKLEARNGGDAALRAYRDAVNGTADPAVAVLLRPAS